MFAFLSPIRNAVDAFAREFDARLLSPETARRVVGELGAIRRVVDGMVAQGAKRVAEADTEACRPHALVATMLGVPVERGLVPLKQACIAARARVEGPKERAQRQRAEQFLRIWTDADGMIGGTFRYAPEVGGLLKAAIESLQRRIFRAHRAGTDHESHEAYAAQALAQFVLGEGATGMSAPTKGVDAQGHILVDHGALMRGGAVDGEVCEIPGVGPVDIGWVRELLGSAFLTVVIKRGKDILTVANLGRHVPAEVRTALIVSGRECDVDDCHHRGYLERDHVHDHAKGGPTSFANLGWLCYRHHRLKSSGWQLGPSDPETRKRVLRPPPGRAA